MANYETLKSAIQQVVKQNGNNEITGALLQQQLLAMVNSLGAGYQYAGIATPAINPGNPDQNIFYIASEPGIYSNFSNIEIGNNEVAILKYNGSWSKETTGISTSEFVQKIDNRFVETEANIISDSGNVLKYGYISDNNWQDDDTVRTLIVPVQKGFKYKLILTGAVNAGFLKNNFPDAINGVIYATGEEQLVFSVGEYVLDVPTDAKYFAVVYSTNSGSTVLVSSITRIMSQPPIMASNVQFDGKDETIKDAIGLLAYGSRNVNLALSEQIYGHAAVQNVWNYDTNARSLVIPVTPGYLYKITSISVLSAMWSKNTQPNRVFDGAGLGYFVIPNGTSKFVAPVDAKYLIVAFNDSGTQLLQSIVEYCVAGKLEELFKNGVVDTSEQTIVGYIPGFIDRDGTVTIYDGFKCTDFIKLKQARKMRIKMPRLDDAQSDVCLAFYDENYNFIPGSFTPSFVDKSAGNNYMEYMDVFIPENALYFRSSTYDDEFASQHSFDNAIKYKYYEPEQSKHITRAYIPNGFINNIIKRAYQYACVNWEPVADLARESGMSTIKSIWPGIRYVDKFLANKKYRGIPYSFSGRDSFANDFNQFAMCVGHQVPIEAFVTAARYANSFLFDKSTLGSFDYNAVAYGGDCVSLVTYALNWRYDGTVWDDLAAPTLMDSIGNIGEIDVTQLRPADVMRNSNHSLIITDVFYENETLMIEVCEETTEGSANNTIIGTEIGGVGYRKLYTAEKFEVWYSGFPVFRLKNASKSNPQYVPNVFAPIDNEPFRPDADLPCIPYMGNMFKFKSGYIPNYAKKVLIGATGFAKLVVMKDNTLFGEYPIINDANQVNVDFSAPGTYTAYLVNDSNEQSAVCKWFVI